MKCAPADFMLILVGARVKVPPIILNDPLCLRLYKVVLEEVSLVLHGELSVLLREVSLFVHILGQPLHDGAEQVLAFFRGASAKVGEARDAIPLQPCALRFLLHLGDEHVMRDAMLPQEAFPLSLHDGRDLRYRVHAVALYTGPSSLFLHRSRLQRIVHAISGSVCFDSPALKLLGLNIQSTAMVPFVCSHSVSCSATTAAPTRMVKESVFQGTKYTFILRPAATQVLDCCSASAVVVGQQLEPITLEEIGYLFLTPRSSTPPARHVLTPLT